MECLALGHCEKDQQVRRGNLTAYHERVPISVMQICFFLGLPRFARNDILQEQCYRASNTIVVWVFAMLQFSRVMVSLLVKLPNLTFGIPSTLFHCVSNFHTFPDFIIPPVNGYKDSIQPDSTHSLHLSSPQKLVNCCSPDER